MEKAWSGRFKRSESKIMEEFTSSLDVDYKLYKEDITGSKAHVEMLAKIKLITDKEKKDILEGLRKIGKEIEEGLIEFHDEDEDIHMVIEKRLTELIGDTGMKLHTARSRNDQINIDMRLFLKNAVMECKGFMKRLIERLLAKAEEHQDVILPGFTHMQPSQPITLAFYYCAYIFQFLRDYDRLAELMKRVDVCTLGSGAFAGVNYKTDRDLLARELGMSAVSENAMDAVSDRDFIIEFLSASSIIAMHMSRLNEEIILWANPLFNFITIDDRFATGSSIMPNKKNPDASELIRGKTGRIYGNLVSLLVTMKSLPLAYNRDMQEDKLPLLDTIRDLQLSLRILPEIIDTLIVNGEAMRGACGKGYVQATDIADYLVHKGLPFRSAHEIVGNIVLSCEERKKLFSDIPISDYKGFSPLFEEDIYEYLELEKNIQNKQSYGSTSFDSVKEQIKMAKDRLKKL
ncbi:argininosuccinate lyase [Spirochaetota bacterium]